MLGKRILKMAEGPWPDAGRAREVSVHLRTFLGGLRRYERDGVTPGEAFQSMRQLHFLTNGRMNDAMAAAVAVRHPRRPVRNPQGILGNMEGPALQSVLENLKDRGFHVFDRTLPAATVDALTHLAETAECVPTVASKAGIPTRGAPGLYRAILGQSCRFDFLPAVSLTSSAAQDVCADPSVLSVAGHYLGCEPVLDSVAMWWSRPQAGSVTLRSEAAQMFHVDMDRLKFLKFFVYLTDVESDTGPHCFIEGSHRRKPRGALREGRWDDAELAALYPPSAFKEFTGPKGTILAVDTRGFHKGKEVLRAERLLFQMEFSISMFGQMYPPLPVTRASTAMKRLAAEHPRTTSALSFQG